jgi:Zn-finger nucleic acid-binding protein
MTDTVRLVMDAQVQKLGRDAGVAARRSVGTHGALSCPRCRQSMRRVVAGDVEVDLCDAHGAWFDRGELARVKAALQAQVAAHPTSPPSPSPSSSSSGLELARTPRPKPEATPPSQWVDVDTGAQKAINNLRKHEAKVARREQRRRRYWNATGGVDAWDVLHVVEWFFR